MLLFTNQLTDAFAFNKIEQYLPFLFCACGQVEEPVDTEAVRGKVFEEFHGAELSHRDITMGQSPKVVFDLRLEYSKTSVI